MVSTLDYAPVYFQSLEVPGCTFYPVAHLFYDWDFVEALVFLVVYDDISALKAQRAPYSIRIECVVVPALLQYLRYCLLPVRLARVRHKLRYQVRFPL